MSIFDTAFLSNNQFLTFFKLADAAYIDPLTSIENQWDTFIVPSVASRYVDDFFISESNSRAVAATFIDTSDQIITISFRGMDNAQDLFDVVNLLPGLDNYITAFDELLQSVASLILNNASYAGYKLWITGHSFGGAAVNQLRDIAASSYGGVYEDATFVAFESPVIATRSDGIFNFGHENDWVFKTVDRIIIPAIGVSHQELNFENTTDNVVRFDDSYQGVNVLFDPTDLSTHDRRSILDTLERIRSSEFYHLMDEDSTIIVDASLGEVSDPGRQTQVSAQGHTAPRFFLGDYVADEISGGARLDYIEGRSGNDVLRGGAGADVIYGGMDNDEIFGDGTLLGLLDGNDELRGGEGDDVIYGGGGNDRIYDGNGFDVVQAGAGNDIIYGGDDFYDIDAGAGNDTIFGGIGFGAAGGSTGNDTIYGGAGGGIIYGGAGTDVMYGGSEAMIIAGQQDMDRMWGGGEDQLRDSFIYYESTDSSPGRVDNIMDFEKEFDVIDVDLVDANQIAAGRQDFRFIGQSNSGVLGDLWYRVVGVDCLVRGNTDRDAAPELEIRVRNVTALDIADFLI